MQANLDGVEVTEIFDRALVAVQGPKAEERRLASCAPAARDMKFMETIMADIMAAPPAASRAWATPAKTATEISIPEAEADPRDHKLFLAHDDCEPAGLGARDSLRLEGGLCLYGNDIDQSTSPVEASAELGDPEAP